MHFRLLLLLLIFLLSLNGLLWQQRLSQPLILLDIRLLDSDEVAVGSFYFDSGSGFNEGEKVDFSYATGHDLQRLVIPFSLRGVIKQLRFDPLPGKGEVVVERLTFADTLTVALDLPNLLATGVITPLHEVAPLLIEDVSAGLPIRTLGDDPHLLLATDVDFSPLRPSIRWWLLAGAAGITLIVWLLLLLIERLRAFSWFTLRPLTLRVNLLFWGCWLLIAAAAHPAIVTALGLSGHVAALTLVFSFIPLLILWLLLIVLTAFIDSWSQWLRMGVFTLLFVIAPLYYLDHHLFSLQQIHLSLLLQMVWSGDGESLWQMINATGINNDLLLRYGIALALLPVCGGLLFFFGERWRLMLRLSLIGLFLSGGVFVALLFIEQQLSSLIKSPVVWELEQRSFPLYLPFLRPKLTLPHYRFTSNPPIFSESVLPVDTVLLPRRNNIFLFVLESLRGDVVDAKTAPNLLKLQQLSLPLKRSLANSNATHHAWFALFNSRYPIFWNSYRDQIAISGSLPLRLLRQGGYGIHLFSATPLDYFDYERLIFGDDPFYNFNQSVPRSLTTPERDRFISEQFSLYLHNHQAEFADGGEVVIVLLDSTHHNYFWPDDFSPPFLPILQEMDYLKSDYSPTEIEAIRNRYLNALFYIDGLMGDMFTTMHELALFDEAIIVASGDHGEEFFEHGHLAHSSTLYNEQIGVYLAMKMPSTTPLLTHKNVISQVDIFPSLLDYLEYPLEDLVTAMDGHTIFDNQPHPVLSSSVRGLAMPELFSLYNGDAKIIFTLVNNELKITEILDDNDQPFTPSHHSLDDYLAKNFSKLLPPSLGVVTP
ncbi:MAG: sulfatase-like hydrolase/transferase [Gammaproteobacteria bacterium]|nr:sulfatase-like hydrolase/transferase [Gammaproteobacteria bacterium]